MSRVGRSVYLASNQSMGLGRSQDKRPVLEESVDMVPEDTTLNVVPTSAGKACFPSTKVTDLPTANALRPLILCVEPAREGDDLKQPGEETQINHVPSLKRETLLGGRRWHSSPMLVSSFHLP